MQVIHGQSALRIAVAAITVCGLVLRMVAGSGDLWLDEIWSLDLLGKLTSIDQVLWRINHDNNHFLNSAYLYLTGPDVPPLLHRALAIALGAATVLAAAAVTADRGPATQLVAALLFAVSYPMIHYGSEARGYSGLVLFTLLSIFFLQRRIEKRDGAVAFGLSVLFGFLSHLTMLLAVAVLVVWAAWRLLIRTGRPLRAGLETVLVFLPALIAVVPLALCVIYGATKFGFVLGSSSTFAWGNLVVGYGGLIRYLFGLPARLPDWLLIVAVVSLVGLSAWKWRGQQRASLYVIGIIGLPLLMGQAHLPTLEFPRYFLVSGALVLLWAAEMLGRALYHTDCRRWAAALALASMVPGNGLLLSRAFELGRGSYSSIVDEMTRNGLASYTSSNAFRTPMVVDFYATRLGRVLHFVPADEWCGERPDWLIVEMKTDMPAATERTPGCDLTYDHVATSNAWIMSGVNWALYRKREERSQVLSEFDALMLTPVMR